MLEHSTMLCSVSPMLEEDIVFPDFYTRLGPCELQDPLWVKMSTVAAGATKKRKKSDTKPQAQINKCNNEKRRREQENIYIEELAELISANIADLSSTSARPPDKCAILQETVNQIRHIKEREQQQQQQQLGVQPASAPAHQQLAAVAAGSSTDAVQQGEVSSSRPTILANDVIAPLLLEALEGFVFVVNADGKVEFVTENVASFIRFSHEEVLGKSIYNIIHHGDHTRFSSNLQPMTLSWGAGGVAGAPGGEGAPAAAAAAAAAGQSAAAAGARSRSFTCRLLVKPPDDCDETMEEKQTRVQRYELMHISSAQVPHPGGERDDGDGGAEPGPCLMCLARRAPHTEKAAAPACVDQFTTKLDTTATIVRIDASGVSAAYGPLLGKELEGRALPDLVLPQDRAALAAHLQDALATGHATGTSYRLRLAADRVVRVHTKSKLFKSNTTEPDFIMAMHSIIGDHESAAAGAGSGTAASSENDAGGGGGGMGGPLMTSVMNGARNGLPISSSSSGFSSASDVSTASSNNLLANTSASFSTFPLTNSDLDFEFFPSTTWELEAPSWGDARPDSCQSVTPVSTPTPRPPSAPVYSPPAPPALPSPFTAQTSPAAPNPPTPANPFSSSFPFSPLAEPGFPAEEPRDSKENVLEEASAMAESGRLRNLLTKPPNSSSANDASNDAEVRNKHRILKGLLDQADEEENRSENRASPRGLVTNRSNNVSGSADQPKNSNNMLLRLLNEKSDDDDLEQRAGLKKQSELLHQLLKEQDQERKPAEQQQQSQDDSLLRSLGFHNSPSPPGGTDHGPARARKRPSDERDDIGSKRSGDSVQVTSSGPSVGNSKLCEKNKMLASLLAKQPSSTPIPPIPASVISATPQDKLPKVSDIRKNNFNMMNQNATATSQSNSVDTRQNRMRMVGRPNTTNYLNQMLTPSSENHNVQSHSVRQQQSRNQFVQMDTNTYATAATSSTENSWDNQSDPLLSDILDQVIDIVPDAVMTDSSTIMNLLDAIESPQNNNNNFQQVLNEKMAINAIQKSLMQCETAVKSPSSPTISLPGTPPAYSASPMTSAQTSQQAGFPPPVYQRSGHFTMQRGPQIRTGGPQYAMAGGTMTPNQQQQLIIQQQQRKMLQQQQEHKRRLLQQQRQQQLLIQTNMTADLNTSLQNIDTLLNSTVAPNVTLQRSSSVPDSQLSPGYSNSIINVNNGSQGQRHGQQPYSPHAQLASPLGQQQTYPQTTVNNFQQTGARLSPHPPFQQQLSPRQGYPPSQANTQTANWSQQQQANRLSLQQQQNPMLNAQLTGSYAGGGRGFPGQRQQQQPTQQQRAMGSPGSAATRQSPFPAETFPPPTSPTSGFTNQSQFQQQLRLQRTISAPPSGTTQLPGGLGSPRQYAGRDLPPPQGPPPPSGPHPHHHHHSPMHHYPPPPPVPQAPPHQPPPVPPAPPNHNLHQHSMVYQEPQYCYDQTGLQLAYNGSDRGRCPPPHLQGGGVGNGNGMNATSEYVRQELRAVVGARTGQAPPPGNRVSSQLHGQQVSPADLEALGLSFEMPTTGASDSPKLWGAMGSDMGSMSPQPPTLSSSSRTTSEEMGRQGDQKSSLLQKLLSE